MNYFDFYELPVSFYLDEAALKRKFLQNSKAYHPDFHTLSDESTQERALELASLNTAAFKVLSDFDRRMEYILQLKGVLEEGQNNQLPNDFLMEMMEINEKVMDLQFDFDAATLEAIKTAISTIEKSVFEEVKPILEKYDEKQTNQEEIEKIKIFYLKNKYLLRIQKTISTFAPH